MKKIILFFLFSNHIFSEKIITAKNDLPDSYFGLKMGAVISPAFGVRLRENSSGKSNARKDDRTGFSMPWTLFMISKEWEEKKISVEFWGEVLRASNFSADTSFDSGNKTNPYTFNIRRANIKKVTNISDTEITFVFGIHELPHTYSQWKGYWNWRYLDRAPLESLGFSSQPADLGASVLFKFEKLTYHFGIVNGEGYRETQNTNSAAYDAVGRFSFEPEFFKGKLKLGNHIIARAGNLFGASGNECREGVTTCIRSDNNPLTRLEKDLRFQKSENLAYELNLLWSKWLNFGLGIMNRKFFTGMSYDRANLSKLPIYETDASRRAYYTWISFSYEKFTVLFRYETGNGVNGILQNQANSRFKRNQIFLEYNYSESARFGFGGSVNTNYDFLGKEKIYIDNFGEESSLRNYLNQFSSRNNQSIVSYSFQDKQIFFRSSFDF